MTTSLTELIVSLRKLNPTFTDEIIRGHLINLGNTKETVDEAFRVINGGSASALVQNAERDMSKGVVFEEDTNGSKKGYGYDGGPSFLGKDYNKKKHHRIRNFLFFIIFIVASVMGTMYYFGTLTLSDFRNIKVDWSQIKNTEYLKKEGKVFLDESYAKILETVDIIKSKFIVPTPELSGDLLSSDDDINMNSNKNSNNVTNQIQKVNKIRNALNAYAGVYGDYPLSLNGLTITKTGVIKVELPLLTEEDILDEFSGKVFIYKKDPKTGFSFSYDMKIPENAIQYKSFYDFVDYRLVYNAKTKTSSFVPIFKYANGTNTATRDSISLEAIRTSVVDINKNLVPDSLE